MKTCEHYHDTIDTLVDGLMTGRIKPPQAVEINNAIGKKIGLMKLQLEYAAQRGKLGKNAARIPALEDAKEVK